VARAWRERRERPALLFLFAWIAVIVVIFSLSRTQLPHYVAPALPAGALLVGLYVAERLRAPERAFLVEIAAILAIEAVGLALVVAGMAREGAWRWAYLAPVAITAAALASAGLLCRRDPAKLRGALALAVAAMALISTFLLATDPFRVYEARSTRPEALFAQRDARPGDAVLLYPNIPFSYAWTVWPQTVPCAERLGELVAALNRPQRTIVFSREKDVLDDLRPRVRWPIQVLLRTRKGILFATVPTEAPHARDEPAPP
jgi:4-amino-4-deoxy-L-arabinose transferase-like glycosyltransferase